MRRLVFITQAVDSQHPALAATIPKIRALAARVDDLVVLAQSARGDELPDNVDVRVAGIRRRPGQGDRPPLVRPRRIPLVLWYTHWNATWKLRAAERLATAVVSVDRRSFPLDSAKVRPIGHGIDVNEFSCAERARHDGLHALVLGRYSPAKGLPTILEAAGRVDGVTLEIHGAALSPLELEHRRELERFGHELGDAVPRAELPRLFSRTDVLVNNMRAGAPDKVVYEAAAACLPVLASNPVFDELFGEFPLLFERDDPESLAERLRWVASRSPEERAEIGLALRERVALRHSVETWADGVLAAIR